MGNQASRSPRPNSPPTNSHAITPIPSSWWTWNNHTFDMCNYVENIFVSVATSPPLFIDIWCSIALLGAPKRTWNRWYREILRKFRGERFSQAKIRPQIYEIEQISEYGISSETNLDSRGNEGEIRHAAQERTLLRLSQRMKSPPMSNTPAHTFSLEHMEPMQQQPVDNLQVRLIHYALNIAK